MKLTYDADADAAYIYFVDSIARGGVVESRSSMLDLDRAFIAFDFGSDGKLLGIEILGASRVLPQDTLRVADQSG